MFIVGQLDDQKDSFSLNKAVDVFWHLHYINYLLYLHMIYPRNIFLNFLYVNCSCSSLLWHLSFYLTCWLISHTSTWAGIHLFSADFLLCEWHLTDSSTAALESVSITIFCSNYGLCLIFCKAASF